MNPDLLRAVGEALYGPQWQSELARDLAVADRTMRRWVAGEFNMPEAVPGEILRLCEERGAQLAALAKRLRRIGADKGVTPAAGSAKEAP